MRWWSIVAASLAACSLADFTITPPERAGPGAADAGMGARDASPPHRCALRSDSIPFDAGPLVAEADRIATFRGLGGIAYYRLNDVDGGVAVNALGNGHAGKVGAWITPTASLLPSSADPAARIPARNDGGDEQTSIVVDDSAELRFTGLDYFSLEVWLQVNEASAGGIGVASKVDAGVWTGWALYAETSDSMRIEFARRDRLGGVEVVSEPIADAITYHVVVVHSSRGLILYVNGRIRDCVLGASPKVRIPDSNDKLYIGTVPGARGAYDGILDELVFYRYSLDDLTVARHWLSGQGAPQRD